VSCRSPRGAGFWRLAPAGVGLLFFLFADGCARDARRPVQRLAIPPIENLSDDGSLAWVGRALSEMASAELAGSASVHPMAVASSRESALAGANSVLWGYFTLAGGRIRLRVYREDLASGRMAGAFSAENDFPAGLFRIGGALARWISPDARAYDTQSVNALQAFAEGLGAPDPGQRTACFERSVALDPDFGAPYVAWARSLLTRGDRGAALALIEKALARGDRIADVRRAELSLLAAALSGNSDERHRALRALSRVTPADPDVFRQLAAEEMSARRYDAAAEAYRKAVSLDSGDAAAWNQLGYAEALRGNLPGARKALDEYARLAPNEANPIDSLGDAHYYLGAFRDAEKYYLEAYQKAPAFLGGAELYKAARARLMTGDVRGADGLFQRYAAARRAAQDPVAGYREAQWMHLTGRKAEGTAQMKTFAASTRMPEALSLAASQLAIWSLADGARGEAAAWASKAASAAGSTSSRQLAALCQALSGADLPQGALAGDWGQKAVAFGSLLGKRYADAVPVLKTLIERTNPLGPERFDVLLAWALVETGRVQDAASLLQTYGLPQPGAEDPFVGLSFPRLFQLKAVVLEKEGRSGEAAAMQQTYQKLSGGWAYGRPVRRS
jgi:tetratricopeptide (TPR) repeat protein